MPNTNLVTCLHGGHNPVVMCLNIHSASGYCDRVRTDDNAEKGQAFWSEQDKESDDIGETRPRFETTRMS